MGEAIVAAVNNWDDPDTLADIATSPGKGMKGEANADRTKTSSCRVAASNGNRDQSVFGVAITAFTDERSKTKTQVPTAAIGGCAGDGHADASGQRHR